jgi:3-hydroxymyristoyl/3-hydroxydecanoyl-(acyl carrier protein) dehydratase
MTGLIITTANVLTKHINGQEARYRLLIPGQLVYFEGHFPDRPILPGLVQIKWAVDFAKNLSGRFRIKQISRLKFSGVILPNTTLTLAIHYKAEEGRADFCYINEHNGTGGHVHTFSQGQLIYRD